MHNLYKTITYAVVLFCSLNKTNYEFYRTSIIRRLISISDDEKQITYCNHHKSWIVTNPEGKVQA